MMTLALRRLRGTSAAVILFLLIEFLDEFVYGVGEAAWPLIRDELSLSYVQIGLLIGLPSLLTILFELPFGLLADLGYRRRIVIGGGIAFTLSLVLTAVAGDFAVLLVSFILFFPASGAFVSLSQASLMDSDPTRHEQNMARWNFAGSVGVVCGALAVGALSFVAASWRALYALSAGASLIALWMTARMRLHVSAPTPHHDTEAENDPAGAEEGSRLSFTAALRDALRAARDWRVFRWVILLVFMDLMLDKLMAYMALYFVDVGGVSEAEASAAVAIYVVVGLLGDLLAIPLLERVRGLTYIRVSALLMLLLFPAFLLVPGFVPKIILATCIGLCNSGWYSVLQGQLYSAMPGRSGTVTTLGTFIAVLDSAFPLAIGALAQAYGLGAAMWLLLLGPLALILGVPRSQDA